MEFNLRERLILFVIAGSRSYNLHTPESDVDVKGVCIPPIDRYRLGLHAFEQADGQEHIESLRGFLNLDEMAAAASAPLEGSVYDIRKFIDLCLNANPNILEVLFCDDSDIRFITEAGYELRKNREIFLSKKVAYSYQGYAFAQMKRIKTHRGWLLDPPQKEPVREDFGLEADRSSLNLDEQNTFLWVLAKILEGKLSESRLSKQTKEELSEIGLFDATQAGVPDEAWPVIQNITGAPKEFVRIMQKERAYRSARQQWTSYLNWKKTRNPKRAALEAVCGYDSKHAMHLARLMVQGREILEKGTLTVRIQPPTRDWLIGIRNGGMPFDELEAWFENEQKEMTASAGKSSLPKTPDRNLAEELLIRLHQGACSSGTDFPPVFDFSKSH